MGNKGIEIPFKISMTGNAQSVFQQITKGFNAIAKGLRNAAKAQLDLKNTDVANALGTAALAITNVTESYKKADAPAKKMTKNLQDLSTEFKDISKGSSNTAIEVKAIFAAIASGKLPIDDARVRLKALQDQFHRFRVAGKDVEAVRKRWELLTAGVKVGSSEWKDAEKKTKAFGMALGDIANKLKQQGVSTKGWTDSIKENKVAHAQRNKELIITSNGFKILKAEGYKALNLNKDQTAALKKLYADQTHFNKALERASGLYAKGDITAKAYDKAVRSIGKSLGWNNERFKQFGAAIEKSHTALVNFKDRLKLTDKTLLENIKDLNLAAVAQAVVAKSVKVTTDGFKILNKQGLIPFGNLTIKQAKNLGILDASFGRMISQEKRYQAVSKKSSADIKKTTQAMHDQGVSFKKIEQYYKDQIVVMRDASKASGKFAQNMTKLGQSMLVYARYMVSYTILRGIIDQFHAGTTAIIEYDQALHDLKAIMNATDTEVQLMSKSLLQVAKDTKFSMGEVGEGMRKLGQAGFSATESMQAIGGIANLATGTLESLESTVNLVATAVRVFGISMTDTTDVADIFANAVNRSRLTIDKLNTSFNYIGPLASAAGLSLKDTSAAMMLLANAGVRASTIGTGFRRILGGLLKPTGAFKEAIYAAGFAIEDFNPAYNDFSEIIERLPEVVVDAQAALEMFGYRGSSVISAFATQGADEFNRLKNTLDRSGSAMQMAAEQMRGLAVQLKNMRDKFGVLAKTIGEGGFTTVLRGAVFVGRQLLDFFITIAGDPIGKFLIDLPCYQVRHLFWVQQ